MRAICAAFGVNVDVEDHEAIWDRNEGFDDPNGIVLGYVIEERMRG